MSVLRRSLALVTLLGAGTALARDAQAQTTTCAVGPQANTTSTTHHTTFKQPSGQYNDFWGGGILVRCPAKKITLTADSAEIYGDEKRVFLVGHVNYREPRITLTSDFLNYFMAQERIVAYQNVHARLPTGSRLDGSQAEYLRAAKNIRPRSIMNATSRPTVYLVQKDAQGKEDPPTKVIATTMNMDGDSLVYAGGDVQITRQDYYAHGDSAFIDAGHETMQLMKKPSVEGQSVDHPFKLVGNLIDMFSRQRKLQRVISRGAAVATSKDMVLKSDTIDLRISNDLLQRSVAWGRTSRARATSPNEDMTADSIDVIMPQQKVREVRSLRRAYAQGTPDTTKFRTSEKDWMKGDTIFAYFDTVPPPPRSPRDTSRAPAIRQLVAIDSASAYYHLPPQDSCTHLPAINYVRGHRITVDFEKQQLATVKVDGKVGGVLIEPNTDSVSACARKEKGDTTKAKADTGKKKPDSSAVRPKRP